MTKYNLLFVLNDPYIKFAYLFLNSLFKNTDIDNLKKIIVINIGLSTENMNILKNKYPETLLEFYQTDKNFGFSRMHSKEWIESLTYKTKSLLKIIENNNNDLPIVMIDTDMLVLKDFNKFINTKFDIQFCKREFKSSRRDINMSMKYIASFMIVNKNSEVVIRFLNDWINEIENMIQQKLKPAYETPSMCKMIEKYKNILNFDELDERNISCDKKYIENITYIIHMKSVGKEEGEDGNFNRRINNVKNFSKNDILKYVY